MDEVQELSEWAKRAVQDVWLIILNMSPVNDDKCDGERFPITFFFFWSSIWALQLPAVSGR